MERLGLRLGMAIWIVVVSAVSARTGNWTDKLSLLAFKAKINSDPLGVLESWNESVQLCSWNGIKCGRRHQRVTSLDLRSCQLEGRLSLHIGNLSFLRMLDLQNNSFGLEIPQEIGRLFRLQALLLANNSFSGEIPGNITGCSGLRFLNLYRNNLRGKLWNVVAGMSRLRLVNLSGTRLAGGIPDSIGNLTSLERISLGSCNLRGTIPSSLGRLKNLRNLVLQSNSLTGTVPLSLYNVSTFEMFILQRNKLEGSLPPSLGFTLPNLKFFSLIGNNFFGSIPISIANATNLVIFQIDINNFTGNVPSLANSPNLRGLSLSSNNLGFRENGDLNFVHDLVNCSQLRYIKITRNNFGGAIPEAISNMTSTVLRKLDFGVNHVTGKIPAGIGNLVSLEILMLHSNNLIGHIPSTVGNLRRMNRMTFDINKLSGTIPPALGNLTSLNQLSLAGNNIQGPIPPSLGECKNLLLLSLAENNLSGSLPSRLFSLTSLSQGLDLSRNQLAGSIPMEVGELVNLGVLDISENKLFGEIPKSLGSCSNMEYLYLQGNFLGGSIPIELNSLRGVRVIDFSRNNLSGLVPVYFADFRGLQFLNFSFNEFEGQVPLQGIYKNASKFSISGNTRLCGGLPELKLPTCTSNLHRSQGVLAKKKLLIVIACSAVGLMVLMFLVVFIFCSRKQSKPIIESSVMISLPRVSYEDLSKATNGFSLSNLIGVGSFGRVYRGILNQNRLVAIKVLNLDISRALKSFMVECESLGSIRHRNILRLITVCSSIDSDGSSFKALVSEFMENGNLDEWLHSKSKSQEQSRPLSLIQRINIAIDVANALDYLHNHGPEPIAHCDIKPSNILLDSQMLALVGDFGLAKFLKSSNSSPNETRSIGVRGTVGYIAPEYVMGSEVSTISDIYSYGIFLLEMFTGKKPTDGMFKDDFNLHNYASMALQDHVSEILCPKLLEEENENRMDGSEDQAVLDKCLTSIIEIGVACSSTCPDERTNMGDVVGKLIRIRDALVQGGVSNRRVNMSKNKMILRQTIVELGT